MSDCWCGHTLGAHYEGACQLPECTCGSFATAKEALRLARDYYRATPEEDAEIDALLKKPNIVTAYALGMKHANALRDWLEDQQAKGKVE